MAVVSVGTHTLYICSRIRIQKHVNSQWRGKTSHDGPGDTLALQGNHLVCTFHIQLCSACTGWSKTLGDIVSIFKSEFPCWLIVTRCRIFAFLIPVVGWPLLFSRFFLCTHSSCVFRRMVTDFFFRMCVSFMLGHVSRHMCVVNWHSAQATSLYEHVCLVPGSCLAHTSHAVHWRTDASAQCCACCNCACCVTTCWSRK